MGAWVCPDASLCSAWVWADAPICSAGFCLDGGHGPSQTIPKPCRCKSNSNALWLWAHHNSFSAGTKMAWWPTFIPRCSICISFKLSNVSHPSWGKSILILCKDWSEPNQPLQFVIWEWLIGCSAAVCTGSGLHGITSAVTLKARLWIAWTVQVPVQRTMLQPGVLRLQMMVLRDVLQAYCCAQLYPPSNKNGKGVLAGQNTRIPGTTSTQCTV